MSGGFGRKGVALGSPTARTPARPASRPPSIGTAAAHTDDGLSPEARAFIAAERSRKPEEAPSSDPIVSATAASASGNRFTSRPTRPERSLLLAYVYWWFGGILGAHRFYLGERQSAIFMPVLFFGGLLVMLVTPLPGVAMICICVGWNLIDGFLIPGMYRRYNAERRSADVAYVFS